MSKSPVQQHHVLLLVTIGLILSAFQPSHSKFLSISTETPRRLLDSILGQTTWPLHQLGLHLRPKPLEYRDQTQHDVPNHLLVKQLEEKDVYILKLEQQLAEASQRYADSVLLHDILNEEGLRFLDARVSRRSLGTNVQSFSIRRGQQDGLTEGLVAVSTTNLVGKISQTSFSNSTVLPVMMPGHRLVVQLTPPRLNRLNHDASFPDVVMTVVVAEKGLRLKGVLRDDMLIKSGFLAHLHRSDPNWPQEAWGLVVGVVESIRPDPMDPTSAKEITLRPAISPQALNKVIVIVPRRETPKSEEKTTILEKNKSKASESTLQVSQRHRS